MMKVQKPKKYDKRGRPRKDQKINPVAGNGVSLGIVDPVVSDPVISSGAMQCPSCRKEFSTQVVYDAHVKYCAEKVLETMKVESIRREQSTQSAEISRDPIRKNDDVMDFGLEKIQLFIASAGDIAAENFGDHWRLSSAQVRILAEAWKPIADRYAVKLQNPFVLALGTTIAVFYPKVMAHAKLKSGRAGSSFDRRQGGKRQDNSVETMAETGS
jgi:hypothetical protein